MPRTDFTGETDYATRISKASGGKFSAAEIRRISKQQIAA
ncbi:putative 8.4 kDa cro protein [Candidatus Erwinia dacicola]|uniref:8.4 kDa cro protein n=1 Tax=Candidatus Erwinia dacicola TaxID=252393 RepID=A0A328TW69_9GAMM|nr:putative 8.4 kDa cro protein [Candidatus Erwinia dacicola]